MNSHALVSAAIMRVPLATGALALFMGLGPAAYADQQTQTGNTGTLTATARLTFNIGIAKYVMLRVGNADASTASVTFAVGPAAGNSQPYSGTLPPALSTTVTSSNPTGAGALTVGAYTNVTGTSLTCSLSPLSGTTAFATGATAGGIPGTSTITVTSGGAGTLQHPGTSLAACNGATPTAIAALSTLTGTFTYSATSVASALAAGTYGNVVTYTATTP